MTRPGHGRTACVESAKSKKQPPAKYLDQREPARLRPRRERFLTGGGHWCELGFSASWRHWVPVDDPSSKLCGPPVLDSLRVLLCEASQVGASRILPLE